MSEILIVNGSARLNGNTQKIVGRLTEGVPCKILNLAEHYLLPYSYENNYTPEDQFEQFGKELLFHQHIIFATPVYWYSMSGKLKNFFDRITDWVSSNTEIGRNLKGKSMQLIAVGTDGDLPDGFTTPFFMTANYLDMQYRGHLYFNSDKTPGNEEIAEMRKSFFSFSAD
ncbi:flavodoxin family protein [Pedobacter sp. AW1-32]|uniref:flavodoxin family protein n=1 Tax=Pedobacter sp. AW1-32 TaxID=3383026 RepID=UPI003FF0CD68